MLDTVVISGEDVGCSAVFGTLVGVFMFSAMLLMMRSAIRSSVYECQRVVYAGFFLFFFRRRFIEINKR